VQTPLEIFFAGQLSVEPPAATTQSYDSLALFVQPRSDRSAAFHPFIPKVVEACAGAAFGKVFVSHGDNIDRRKLNRDVERIGPTVKGRSQYNLQHGFPVVYFKVW
jgi:hypothetical protein